MFPMFYQLVSNSLVAYALAHTSFSTITLEPLGLIYRVGSLLFGLALTAIGIASGIFNRPASAAETDQKVGSISLAQPGNA